MEVEVEKTLRGMATTFMKFQADRHVYWLNYGLQKNPLDLWIMQEIIYMVKPDVVIECGTGRGGSAFFFASILQLIGKGRVISVDAHKRQPLDSSGKERVTDYYNRVEFIYGNSVAPEIFSAIKEKIKPDDVVLVDLDSDHGAEHVSKEMKLYSDLVTPGSYMIVEDGIVAGPTIAIDSFLKQDDRFIAELAWEKFLFTFNPKGYLKRIK